MAEDEDPYPLLRRAEKKEASARGSWKFLSNREQNFEEAAQAYQGAGAAFRKKVLHKEAAGAYEKAAVIHRDELGGGFDMATSYISAFESYRKLDDFENAERTIKLAIAAYVANNHMDRVSRKTADLAALYESRAQGDEKHQQEMRQKAADAYENAAESEVGETTANTYFIKAADLEGLLGDYQKAAQHYEKVARKSVDNNLLRFSVKNHLFKAGICHLATRDIIPVRRALEGYCELDPGFARERECQLLQDLTNAVENNDADAFGASLFNFDQIYRLDSWKTAILIRIKNGIGNDVEEFY